MASGYDAILVVSFGGPECREDVIPFLENVLRGKPVPRERMLEVAEHYYHFGGASPINDQIRALIAALEGELQSHGISLPVYWGNRNWHPLLADTLRQMQTDGVRQALAWVTSTYSCYSGCRQYREDIEAARVQIGEQAPRVDKIRVFYNHPGFIEAQADRVRAALAQVPESDRQRTWLFFTAHSIPTAMSDHSDYVRQLTESCRLVAETLGHDRFHLVYQSRSGPPSQPWLEPDVCGAIEELHQSEKPSHLVLVPIGFLSDHLEVMYDLDVEAKQACDRLGIRMVRAETVGTHPRFVQMIRELICERLDPHAPRLAIGQYGANHDVCPENCCLYPRVSRPSPRAVES
ncbi:MAG: ferrochelatase [Pirellulaceae bacterium]|nr:ferrochelatase [Pirellulaceae bacterium]